ncbi:MAG: tRNA preQ1(34) S-adenosylmethionine ribosyltransferase-isomerase QueA [Bacteroidaceae bacterium]|nr:tRNA preQ1(34) S-adenosylmethionine ribosyltransferase-isomerase QueA [Bacteroidaceae bacterium]MBR4783211.1 tRNA preQ1(34) S-adenosylmethionine ribosyltransferase-isomerase QueA [Bacteroidaceae bacterium]
MKLSQFKFRLPEDLIAQEPDPFRDGCRMMVLHRDTGKIEHKQFNDLLEYFGDGDVFIFNDTQVIPAHLTGNKERTGAHIDVLLRRELNAEERLWDVIVEPARKIRIGNKLYFGEDDSLVAEVIDNTTSRGRTLRFLYDGTHQEFKTDLYSLGSAPLPSYIKRPANEEDLELFQTIYAKHEGATTAPISGLHFSRITMKKMEIAGVNSAFLTLHCGQSNFNKTDVEDLTKHKMDSEEMHVTPECCEIVNKAKDAGHKILAVGTTVQRAVESCCDTLHHITPFDGWTNKFIYPPYNFNVANAMLAGFYTSESTLLMLTAAFGGFEQTIAAYKTAVKQGYHFGAYGDVMLII